MPKDTLLIWQKELAQLEKENRLPNDYYPRYIPPLRHTPPPEGHVVCTIMANTSSKDKRCDIPNTRKRYLIKKHSCCFKGTCLPRKAVDFQQEASNECILFHR